MWGALAGAALNYMASDSADSSGAASSAANKGKFTPYNVYSGYGSGMFSGNTATAKLSPEYQGIRDNFINQAGMFGGQLNRFSAPTKDQFTTRDFSGAAKTKDQIYQELLSQNPTGANNGNLLAALSQGWQPNKVYTSQTGPNGQPMFNGGTWNNISADENYNQPGGFTWSPDKAGGVDVNALMQQANSAYDSQGKDVFDQAGYDSAVANYKSPEQQMYEQAQAMAAPGEEQARLDMENRLLSQGMLGSADGRGSNRYMRALLEAQGQAANQRQLSAWQQAQEMQNQTLNRETQATNAASGVDALPLQNLNLGGAFGGQALQGSQFGANLEYGAAQNANNSTAALWGGIAQPLQTAIGDYAKNNNWGFNSSPYVDNSGGFQYGMESYADGGEVQTPAAKLRGMFSGKANTGIVKMKQAYDSYAMDTMSQGQSPIAYEDWVKAQLAVPAPQTMQTSYKKGGMVNCMSGGMLKGPGTGTSDSIEARVSDGEFVVNAEATKKNKAFLEKINKEGLMERMRRD